MVWREATLESHTPRHPYTKCLSEELQRIFNLMPSRNTTNQLSSSEETSTVCGAAYEITYHDCNENHIGVTARTWRTRLKKYTTTKGHITSAIAEHLKASGHRVKMDNVRILESEDNTQRKKNKSGYPGPRRAAQWQLKPSPGNRDLSIHLEAPLVPPHMVT